MFSKSLYLLFLCSSVLFQRQVEGPSGISKLFSLKDKGKGAEGDPCADEEAETERSSSSSSSSHGVLHIFRRSKSSVKPKIPVLTAEELKNRANQFFREGKFEEALPCYNKAIKINPDEPKYYRNRGFCFTRLNMLDLAVKDYKKSLDLDSGNVRGQFFLGRQLYEMDLFHDAIEHLQFALDFGEERNMMSDERSQVISMLENARRKVQEIEDAKRKAREEALLVYFKNLIMEDSRRQITGIKGKRVADPDEEMREITDAKRDYLNELEAAFTGADEERQQMSSRQIPEYLSDKISYEIMKEPVITPSGITYEKEQILKHLENRNTDPLSRAPLRVEQLRPNKCLKEYIEDYMKKNRLTYTTSFESEP